MSADQVVTAGEFEHLPELVQQGLVGLAFDEGRKKSGCWCNECLELHARQMSIWREQAREGQSFESFWLDVLRGGAA